MAKQFLLKLLALTVLLWKAQAQRSYATLPNTDYWGNDLFYWYGSFDGCQWACDTTPGCIGFVLDKAVGSNCYLKHNIWPNNIFNKPSLTRDISYLTNQAALRVRLAAKDEWIATIAGESFYSMKFNDPLIVRGKPIDYPQQFTQYLPPGLYVIAVQVNNYNFTDPGTSGAAGGLIAAVSYNDQLIASSVTGSNQSQWFVTTVAPASGWNHDPFFVRNSSWISSSQMQSCAAAIKSANTFNSSYQSYVGSITANSNASPNWVGVPGCNATTLYFRLVINVTSVVVPVPAAGTEASLMSSPWLGNFKTGAYYLQTYTVGTPSSANAVPLEIRIIADDSWELYLNGISVVSHRPSDPRARSIWRLTDINIFLPSMTQQYLLAVHAQNGAGIRSVIYSIKYSGVPLFVSSPWSPFRFTTNQTRVSGNWTSLTSFNDSDWLPLSSMVQCSPNVYGNMQDLFALFNTGAIPQMIWGTSCSYDGINEDLYMRMRFSPSDYLPASLWSTATATSTTTPTASATSALSRSYATLVNFNYPGGLYQSNDLGYFYGSFSDCHGKCDSTPGCIGFINDKVAGANCFLKYALYAYWPKAGIAQALDTVYVKNQAALRVRLAAKDEWIATIAGESFYSMKFNDSLIVRGKPIDYPQQLTQYLPPGLYVIAVQVNNYNFTDPGTSGAAGGLIAAVSYNDQLIASSVTGSNQNQWFVTTVAPASGWNHDPFFVRNSSWISSSQMQSCAAAIKSANTFNSSYQSYVGSITANSNASPNWVGVPGCNATTLYFRLVINVTSVVVPVPAAGTEASLMSSPWLWQSFGGGAYSVQSYTIGSPTAGNNLPLQIRIFADDMWELYLNGVSIVGPPSNSEASRLVDIDIYLNSLNQQYLLAFRANNSVGGRGLMYSIKYGGVPLLTSIPWTPYRFTTNQSLATANWSTSTTFNDSGWLPMSSAAQCDTSAYANIQNLMELFNGHAPRMLWWPNCQWDGVNENLYVRINFNPSLLMTGIPLYRPLQPFSLINPSSGLYLVYDSSANVFRLRPSGVPLAISLNNQTAIYRSDAGFVALRDNSTNLFLNHWNFIVRSNSLSASYEFGWQLRIRSDGLLDIYNDFQPGYLLGYGNSNSSDYAIIVKSDDPRRIAWMPGIASSSITTTSTSVITSTATTNSKTTAFTVIEIASSQTTASTVMTSTTHITVKTQTTPYTSTTQTTSLNDKLDNNWQANPLYQGIIFGGSGFIGILLAFSITVWRLNSRLKKMKQQMLLQRNYRRSIFGENQAATYQVNRRISQGVPIAGLTPSSTGLTQSSVMFDTINIAPLMMQRLSITLTWLRVILIKIPRARRLLHCRVASNILLLRLFCEYIYCLNS